MYGLSEKDLQTIRCFTTYPEFQEAILFRSRPMGHQKMGSDIDIALKGKNIDRIATQIYGILNDESPLPYFFDIKDYDVISNQDGNCDL